MIKKNESNQESLGLAHRILICLIYPKLKVSMDVQRCRNFSKHLEDLPLKNMLRTKYIQGKALQSSQVAIILPTFNRSKLLPNAISSIKNQLHREWTLHICDDGSTDDTHQICRQYEQDPRINYLQLPHKGVSSTRNSGLKKAYSKYIAFLDSDNTWSPEYLSLMVTFIDKFSLDSAYCAARLTSDQGKQWLGDFFSWQACAKKNYIDLNCFMMRTSEKQILFDENLQRFVDWDFILNATRQSRTSYFPSALVNYCNKKSRDRISTTVYRNGEIAERIAYINNKHYKVMKDGENVDVRIKENR